MRTGSVAGGATAGAGALVPAELSASSTTGAGPRRPRPAGGGGEVLNTARYLSADSGTSATHATWLLVLKSWWLFRECWLAAMKSSLFGRLPPRMSGERPMDHNVISV